MTSLPNIRTGLGYWSNLVLDHTSRTEEIRQKKKAIAKLRAAIETSSERIHEYRDVVGREAEIDKVVCERYNDFHSQSFTPDELFGDAVIGDRSEEFKTWLQEERSMFWRYQDSRLRKWRADIKKMEQAIEVFGLDIWNLESMIRTTHIVAEESMKFAAVLLRKMLADDRDPKTVDLELYQRYFWHPPEWVPVNEYYLVWMEKKQLEAWPKIMGFFAAQVLRNCLKKESWAGILSSVFWEHFNWPDPEGLPVRKEAQQRNMG